MGSGGSRRSIHRSNDDTSLKVIIKPSLLQVWNRIIEPDSQFFFNMHLIASQLSSSYAKITEVYDWSYREGQRSQMEQLFRNLFKQLVQSYADEDTKKFDQLVVECGGRHRSYGGGAFTDMLWTIVLSALQEAFQKSDRNPTDNEITVWNEFVIKVIDKMRQGFREAASSYCVRRPSKKIKLTEPKTSVITDSNKQPNNFLDTAD